MKKRERGERGGGRWDGGDDVDDDDDDDDGDPFVRQKYAHHMLSRGLHYNQGPSSYTRSFVGFAVVMRRDPRESISILHHFPWRSRFWGSMFVSG